MLQLSGRPLVSHWVSIKRGAWLIVMMAEFNYFHPPRVVKHADKWANKMAHHHFSIVPSHVYMIMRAGGSFPYLHKPESINPKRIMRLSVCLCLHAFDMGMHVKFCYFSDMQILNQRTIMTKSPHVVPCSHPGVMQDKHHYAHYMHCIHQQIYIFIVIHFTFFKSFFSSFFGVGAGWTPSD